MAPPPLVSTLSFEFMAVSITRTIIR